MKLVGWLIGDSGEGQTSTSGCTCWPVNGVRRDSSIPSIASVSWWKGARRSGTIKESYSTPLASSTASFGSELNSQ
jgi:hypothetical protein